MFAPLAPLFPLIPELEPIFVGLAEAEEAAAAEGELPARPPTNPSNISSSGPGPTPEWMAGMIDDMPGPVRNPGTWGDGYVDPYLKSDWDGTGSKYYDQASRDYLRTQGLSREDMTPEMRGAYDDYVKKTHMWLPNEVAAALPSGLAPANGLHGHPETRAPTVQSRDKQVHPPGHPGNYTPPANVNQGERGGADETHEGVGPQPPYDANDAYLNHDAHNPVHAPSETMTSSDYTQALSRFTNNAFGNLQTMSAKGMNFARFAELSDINGSMAEHARDMLAD